MTLEPSTLEDASSHFLLKYSMEEIEEMRTSFEKHQIRDITLVEALVKNNLHTSQEAIYLVGKVLDMIISKENEIMDSLSLTIHKT